MAKDLSRYFSKDSTQVVTKHMRRHTSLVIRENKIKTKMMYHFILTRMVMLKKSNIGKGPSNSISKYRAQRNENTYVHKDS